MIGDILRVRPEVSVYAMLLYAGFAFSLGLALTPSFLRFLRKNRLGKQLRVETIDGRDPAIFRTYHESKFGTPTMGGILIWGSILATVFFSRTLSYFGFLENSLLSRGQVYLPLFTMIALGLLGGLDDFFNVKGIGSKRGLDVLPKIIALLLISTVGAIWFYAKLEYDSLNVPFFGSVDVGAWYIPIFIFVLVGTANAVNVTDGLDGLAAGLLIIAFASFGFLASLSGLSVLAAFCAVCVGAIAAFLWHNVPPALFFMGDTGSLALGGTLAVMAMMIDQVFVLPLIGFVFVIEMLSVIIQLSSKKLRHGKKVFLAAPLHHHLEALQWGESKVTMRLWIVGSFFAVLGVLVAVLG